jgi:hypothetical protein
MRRTRETLTVTQDAFGVKEQVCPPRRSASPDEVIEGCCFVAVHESAVGTTRTFRNVRYSVAVGMKTISAVWLRVISAASVTMLPRRRRSASKGQIAKTSTRSELFAFLPLRAAGAVASQIALFALRFHSDDYSGRG